MRKEEGWGFFFRIMRIEVLGTSALLYSTSFLCCWSCYLRDDIAQVSVNAACYDYTICFSRVCFNFLFRLYYTISK